MALVFGSGGGDEQDCANAWDPKAMADTTTIAASAIRGIRHLPA